MNYISLIDELGIDIDTIATLNDAKIIRLQKQLKAKAVLEQKSNLGELASLVDEFKDENIRKHHVFVENHKWLKQIISGDYSNIPQSSVYIDHESIGDIEALKHFLEPYLKAHIKPFLSETLNKGKYILLINSIESTLLYTESVEQLIVNFFISKLNYAKVYIEQGKLKDTHAPVAYITNRNFIKCLSQYPNSFTEEVNELNSEVIDTYNSKRKNVDNHIFIFTAKTMVAFGELNTSSYMLKDVLESNADIARPYAYSTGSKSKTKSGFGVGIWSIIVLVVIIIRLVSASFNFSSSSNNTDTIYKNFKINNSDNNNLNKEHILEAIKRIQEQKEAVKNDSTTLETENETINEDNSEKHLIGDKVTLPDIDNSYKSEDHTRFIYALKLKTNRNDESLGSSNTVRLNAFTNPYPKTFNNIKAYISSVEKNSQYSLIKNNSANDLIIFKLKPGIDQSIFIPKDKKIYIDLNKNDSLVFYSGAGFVVDKFSYFKSNATLSKLYIVEEMNGNLYKEINVLPHRLSIYNKTILNQKGKIKDTSKLDVIKTKNIQLKAINIDKV